MCGRYGKVASRHELATGCSGNAVHGGDDRLRQANNSQHQFGARSHCLSVECMSPIWIVPMRREFLKVVTGRESGTCAGQHHSADGLIVFSVGDGAS
jgi:hypothetical protein